MDYAKIYHFYRKAIIRFLRFIIFISFLILISNNLQNPILENLRLPIFFMSFFLMSEIFFRFKIGRARPSLTIKNNDGGDIYKSFTLQSLEVLSDGEIKEIIKTLLEKESTRFILEKADIGKKELPVFNISKEDWSKLAFRIGGEVNGEFVTTQDLFSAYLLLIEPKSNLLFSKKLKTEELLGILCWARADYPKEEHPEKIRVNFWGEGIGENWVTGWTLETSKYTKDLTYGVLSEKPVFVGRVFEYRKVVESLCNLEKNNVLLLGEPGVGVSSLIKNLAFESHLGLLPRNLNHKRILELLIGPLLAGASDQSSLQLRLETIIEEIAHSENIILYLPEAQNIMGASSFNINLTGVLFPYLRDGRLPIILSMTPQNYKLYSDSMKSFFQVFDTVKIEEPDKDTAVRMILENANLLETKYKINITYRAVISCCQLASRFIQDKVLPGSAFLLLSDAVRSAAMSGKSKVQEEDVIKTAEEKTQISIGKPTGEEKDILLNLEDKLHERVVDQKEAIFAIAESLRRLRSGLSSNNKPTSFLFLGPTGVGKTETAKALASLYFKGEDKMIRLDMSEYTSEEGVRRLLGSAPGEGQEKGELTEKILDKPYSLVLLDEFEKANPKILDLFLQVLDDGRLTDNKGKTVSFVNSIIIATSNAASEFIREEIEKGQTVDKNFKTKLLDFLQSRGIFKPELLNRFDAVIVFKPLGEEEVMAITNLMLKGVQKKLLEQDIMADFDEKIIQKIANEGFDRQFGARPLRRFIQDNIEDLLAQKILRDEIKRGDKLMVSVDAQGKIKISNF